MSKNILVYCIIFASAILLAGCRNQSMVTSEQTIMGAKLMLNLESYMSPEEARQRLGSKATSWEKEEEIDINNIETHSSDNYYSVLVKNFSHLNLSGELRLIFLNKQLMMIMFFPEEFYPYAETLIKNEKLRIKLKHIARSESRLAPNVRMEIVDANLFEKGSGPTRSYVSWEDIRLSQQYIKILVASEKAAFPVQLQAQHMFQEITTKITEADASISINENRWIQIDKASGIDTVVLCQAYMPAEELKNKLQVLRISPAAINNIQTAVSAQDGIYLFLLDEGKIVAKGTLGAEVSLAEPVLGVKLQDSLSIEMIRLDQKWRPLQIRKIK